MHTITDNDLFHRLAFDNPWWEFTKDTRIQFKDPQRRVFFPAFVSHVMKAGAGNVLCLAGPLRAGKTVLMRQMVARLIEGGISPKNVFYCNMTVPSMTAADIPTLFEMFCRRYRHRPDADLYVFYDEIQYVKGWEEIVLELAKLRPKARIIAAVSSGAPSLATGETSHGGKLTTFVLPPLTFLEFLRYRGTESTLFEAPSDTSNGDTMAGMTLKANALAALNTEFQRYVNFGGFLEGIAAAKEGTPAPAFIRDGVADRVLHKDLANLYGISEAQELNRLFGLLAFNTAREVTMDDLAKATNIAKNTLRKYLDYLEQAFLIRRVARVDKNGKRFQRQVAFKVYLTTPCLYSALFAPVPPNDQFFQRLAETALVAQWLGSPAVANLAYASWRGGQVDLLTMHPDSDRPDHVYELDWNNSYATSGKGPKTLVQFVEGTNRQARNYILTRTVARPASMRGVEMTLAPLALYTYWLERDPTLRKFHSQ
ncbi:MAG: ATP-binding protein [Rhodospirillaceae bacterium]|nr:ATP-binding protein [Rhodospirillaceae bacterium]